MTRSLLILCLAWSGGVHVALAGEHGLSFALAAAALAAAAFGLLTGPVRATALGTAGLLAALVAAYAVSHAGGPYDAVGLATKAVELLGLALALAVAHRRPAREPRLALVLVAALALAGVSAAATPAAPHAHDADTPAAHGH